MWREFCGKTFWRTPTNGMPNAWPNVPFDGAEAPKVAKKIELPPLVRMSEDEAPA